MTAARSGAVLAAGTRLVLTARNGARRVHNVTILDPDGRTLASVDVPSTAMSSATGRSGRRR